LLKLLTINVISFILTFLICVTNEFSEFNLASLFIILLALFSAFIVYPWSINKCLENIEIQFTKNKISIKGESYVISNVEKLILNYRFLMFPKWKLILNDKSEKNFFIYKYSKDYLDLDILLRWI